MVFDNRDLGVLMLFGLCRYLPADLTKIFKSSYFSKMQIITLCNQKLIKKQSNKISYSLTYDGYQILERFGYDFPKDKKTDIQKEAYKRKVRSSKVIIAMFLAGINVFHVSAESLAGTYTGFVSSLILRSSRNIKVLAGARFLGILKIRDTVYIPYHIEDADEWIVPSFEKEVFTSQITRLKGVKDTKLMLSGKTLEVLWASIYPSITSVPESNGLKRFDIALEELGCDYLLVPENDCGVSQLSIIKIAGYRKRLAGALGCDTENKMGCSESDGISASGVPYLIAFDFNVNRVIRFLKQVHSIFPNSVPKIFCLPFQKNVMLMLLRKTQIKNATVHVYEYDNISKLYPEMIIDYKENEIPKGKDGKYVQAYEKNIRTDTK